MGGKPGQSATFDQLADRLYLLLGPAARKAPDPAGDGILDLEYRITADEDRPERWNHARAQALPSSVDKRMIGTVREIIPRKEAELRQQIFTAELQHRMNNSLAMGNATAAQTLRGDDIADRHSTFLSRLEALYHALDILNSKSWQGATDPVRHRHRTEAPPLL